MYKKLCLLGLFFVVFSSNVLAQCQAESPETLISLVERYFNEKNLKNFSCLFEIETAQNLLKQTIEEKFGGTVARTQFEFGKIIRSDDKNALILFAGLIEFGNSGSETFLSQQFTGVYEAEFSDGTWKVKHPVDYKINKIKSHNLDVEVIPARKLSVRDSLTVDVTGNFGFLVGLNHKARISTVLIDSKTVDYSFGGGLLWIKTPPGKNVEIRLEYELTEIDTDDNDGNSSFWSNEFGHVRNQFRWHPFYGFNSKNDFADFRVKVKIPKQYQLALDIPQNQEIVGESRIITAETEEKTKALTLLYDKGWNLASKNFGQIRLDILANEEFEPGVEEIQSEFEKVYSQLKTRFGEPVSKQFKITQARGRRGDGWHFRSNNAIVTGNKGGTLITESPPRAYFAHEVAHAWTEPTGNGSNFLREGWASFVEGIFLKQKYGKQAEDKMYERYFNEYNKRDFEGKLSILEDTNNQGISYYKGAWIFRMLRDFVSQKDFQAGIRRYIKQTRQGKSDIESFISAFETESEKEVRKFLYPWLKGNALPNLEAYVSDEELKITQTGEIFYLPVKVEFTTVNGLIMKGFVISKKENIFGIGNLNVTGTVKIDPERTLMLSRKSN
jgi:hypothetical protein